MGWADVYPTYFSQGELGQTRPNILVWVGADPTQEQWLSTVYMLHE